MWPCRTTPGLPVAAPITSGLGCVSVSGFLAGDGCAPPVTLSDCGARYVSEDVVYGRQVDRVSARSLARVAVRGNRCDDLEANMSGAGWELGYLWNPTKGWVYSEAKFDPVPVSCAQGNDVLSVQRVV